MAAIRIINLKLKAIIGVNDWERHTKQKIIINIKIDFNAARAGRSDNIKDTLDYKALTKKIIKAVELSHFFLLEKLAQTILNLVLESPLVKEAYVRVDKPLALRFADSVSVEVSKKR